MSTYTDIDLDFTPNPLNGDVPLKRDEDAVKRAIRNLVLTERFDRPFRPELAARVRGLLFELANPLTALQVRSNVISVLERYEPRAKILDVAVEMQPDTAALFVTIVFRMVKTNRTATVKITLTRTR